MRVAVATHLWLLGFCFVIYEKGVTVSRRRVVVTGLGLISPVGNNVADGWANLVAGKSGIANITKFDASNFSTRFAGEVKGFNIEDYIPGKEARHMDTFIHYGVAAGIQAMQDSGLEVTDENSERIGVVVGSGIGGLPMIEATQTELLQSRPAPHFAVLRAGFDHQHDLGPPVDQVRHQGPESRHRDRVYDGSALHRRGFAPDRIRRRRRDDRRRCGIHRVAAGHRRLCGGACAVATQ